MSKVIVQSRVTESLKDEAEQVFASMGITTAEAIRLFLHQTVADYQFPFTPKLRKPSPEFTEAIRELDEGRAERFDNFDAFKASLD